MHVATTLGSHDFAAEDAAEDAQLARLCARPKKMAELYASKPPLAAQMIKNSVNELVYATDDATMHMDYDQTLLTHETKDRKEAVLSFFEKRDPEFTGD